MARARPGLETAINDILIRHGQNGKRLSFRQAERLTGLSPAAIGELAKGNARTPETVRRFAQGMDEDAGRLLLLAGFAPEPGGDASASAADPGASPTALSVPAEPFTRTEGVTQTGGALNAQEQTALHRLERALAHLSPGPDRDLWNAHLNHAAALMERFARRQQDQHTD